VGGLDRREVTAMKDPYCALCWIVATLTLAGVLRWTDED